jgi:hypothetical protein
MMVTLFCLQLPVSGIVAENRGYETKSNHFDQASKLFWKGNFLSGKATFCCSFFFGKTHE